MFNYIIKFIERLFSFNTKRNIILCLVVDVNKFKSSELKCAICKKNFSVDNLIKKCYTDAGVELDFVCKDCFMKSQGFYIKRFNNYWN